MKKRTLPALFLLASLVGLALLLAAAPQDADRPYGSGAEADSTIHFSHSAGFYDEPFYLEIKAPTKEIYYTLDGSEPDRNSLRYTGPIYIEDATPQENWLSARTDVSCDTVIPPEENVDKCTVLRARYYDTFGGSEIITASYFVGFEGREGFGTTQVVSLVTDPKNLTDSASGIYVRGDSFGTENPQGTEWTGNYYGRGPEWEREAVLECFTPEGKLFFTSPCGVRVRGNYSRRDAQKSFNLYSRKEYGGNKTFRYDFWGTGYFPDTMSLHAGGNEHEGKIRNRLVSELTGDERYATMHYTLCQVFLNGEYWGLYDLTEKYDARFISQTYGVAEQNVESIRNRELADGVSDQDFGELLAFVEFADLSQEENYRRCWELMDRQSLIDYYATMVYCARHVDWPVDNVQLWRTVEQEDSPYGDTRWRYMLFDMDSPGLTREDIDHDTVASTMEAAPFFRSLCQREDFRKDFGAAVLRIGREVLFAQRVSEAIDAYQAEMAEPMKPQLRRYFNADLTRFYDSTEDTRAFFQNRLAAMERILARYDMLP